MPAIRSWSSRQACITTTRARSTSPACSSNGQKIENVWNIYCLGWHDRNPVQNSVRSGKKVRFFTHELLAWIKDTHQLQCSYFYSRFKLSRLCGRNIPVLQNAMGWRTAEVADCFAVSCDCFQIWSKTARWFSAAEDVWCIGKLKFLCQACRALAAQILPPILTNYFLLDMYRYAVISTSCISTLIT